MPIFQFYGKDNAAVADLKAVNQLIIGRFNATTAGYGIRLGNVPNGLRTFAMRGNADDGGAALPVNQAYLFSVRRMLLTYPQTGNISAMGGCDRLSIAADETGASAEMSGHWGMLEVKSTGVIGNAAGCGAVRGDININSGGDVATGTFVSCFLAASESVGAQRTGKAVVLHVKKPQVGTYDGLMELQSTSGAVDAHSAGALSSGLQLLITIDGSPYAIPVAAVGT